MDSRPVRDGQMELADDEDDYSTSSGSDVEPQHDANKESPVVFPVSAKDSGPEGNTSASKPAEEPPKLTTMTARAYQQEMYEESLKRNIIVAVCLVL